MVAPVVDGSTGRYDLLADRYHGTGVVGALAGNRTGTNPNVRVVFVAGNSKASWDWVAKQSWIDLVTTSNISVVDGSAPAQATCGPGQAVRELTAAGKLVFTSAGNAEQYGLIGSPNAMPEVYRVGGVDTAGAPWLGVHPEQADPNLALGQVTHPYDSGDLYAFATASSESTSGSMTFGGTSGATPRTVGRAAEVVAAARRTLGQQGRARAGALASGPRVPARGPLRDGVLSAVEVADLLRSTAVPATPPQPARYLIEGYGALSSTTTRQAIAQMLGQQPRQDRSDDDRAHQVTVTARQAMFPPGRC